MNARLRTNQSIQCRPTETFLNSLVQTHKDSSCFIHSTCFQSIIYKTEVIVNFISVDNGIDTGHND